MVIKLAILTVACLASDVKTASIDCSSGAPDLSGGENNVSANECQTQCTSLCASVQNEDQLEQCLTNESLKGCLFQINTAKEHEVNYCVQNSADGTATVGQTIAVKLRGEDLYVTGSSVGQDGTSISDVLVALQLQDTSLFKQCANKGLLMGISSVPYNSNSCATEGTLALAKSYSISNNGEDMLIPIGDALTGLWNQRDDVVVAIQLQDASCGKVDIQDAEAYFSISYKGGYIDNTECWDIDDCIQCMTAKCHWCSYDRTINNVFPDWLPSWDWIQNIKNDENGKCGLSSALCTVSTGKYDTCGATRTTTKFAAAAAGVVSLALYSLL